MHATLLCSFPHISLSLLKLSNALQSARSTFVSLCTYHSLITSSTLQMHAVLLSLCTYHSPRTFQHIAKCALYFCVSVYISVSLSELSNTLQKKSARGQQMALPEACSISGRFLCAHVPHTQQLPHELSVYAFCHCYGSACNSSVEKKGPGTTHR